MSTTETPIPSYDWEYWLEQHFESNSWHEINDDYADWMIAAGFNPVFDNLGQVYATDDLISRALDILVSMGEMLPPDDPAGLPR